MRTPDVVRPACLPLLAAAVVTVLAAGCSTPVEPAPAARQPEVARAAVTTTTTTTDTTTKTPAKRDGGTIPWY